ncbi:hypothetical protein [Streptomyces sp. H27-H5]|uniref:hypothetical protein n=1 Tax=Streptomyces sp. H27-H5 TaxID=2996460 RepID=UPI00226F0F13|nr:hypothetical protein [Streptomyces sp. H27-H5]MCY0957671.1 hypothetical protein [Streptomyces sp. H27-H5]
MTGRSLPRGAYTATPCRACRTPKPSRMYLCPACWAQLTPAAARALNRVDSHALARLRQLHSHIDSGLPLAELEITE